MVPLIFGTHGYIKKLTILQLYFTLKKVCLSAVKVVGTYNINKQGGGVVDETFGSKIPF